MDANAFNAIQDKLRRQVETLRQSAIDVPIDWPTTKSVRTHPVEARASAQRADFQATVETLRQRSSQTVVGAMQNRRYHSPAMAENRPPTIDPSLYQQCLQSLQAGTDILNQLSLQQEQTIVEMQRVHAQLAHLEPVWLEQFGEALRYPRLLFKQVALVSATPDQAGNIVLSHKAIGPLQPEQEARNLAAHLRHTYGAAPRGRFFGLTGLGVELKTLCREPLQGLSRLGSQIHQGLSFAAKRPSRASTQRRSGWSSRPLSVVEAVLWVGGGVIARAALNLLLAAFPSLWMVAVIGITATTAYALYQATLAAKPDLAVASRLLLALGGLVVGGGFGG